MVGFIRSTVIHSVYYIGQHSIHEIGMHSIYEFLTKLTDHQKDDSQWKEWGKRDSDAKAYCKKIKKKNSD